MAPYETLLPYSSPRNAITIKANVCDLAQEPLRAAGLDCRRTSGSRSPAADSSDGS